MAKSKKVAKSSQSKTVSKSSSSTTNEVVSKTVEAAPSVPTLADQFDALLGQLSALRSQLASVTSQVRAVQKRADREIKQANKAARKSKRKSGNRAPSGFVKPTRISQELAKFLHKPKGTEMARTDVTREINSYIREHKLQDPSNRRRILPDSKLKKLLKLKDSDELTYFNLQRYMSHHFAKASSTATTSSSK